MKKVFRWIINAFLSLPKDCIIAEFVESIISTIRFREMLECPATSTSVPAFLKWRLSLS